MTVETLDLETALIGVLLIGGEPVVPLANDVGLQAAHFRQPVFGQAWSAIVALSDRGSKPEPALVAAELGWPEDDPRRAKLYGAMQHAAWPGSAAQHARAIIAAARLHTAGEVARRIASVVGTDGSADEQLAEVARLSEQILPDTTGLAVLSMEDRFEAMMQHALPKSEDGVITFPWRVLNTLMNDFQEGELTLLGGITGHGKSVIVDMIVEHVLDKHEDTSAGLYLTESRELSRDLRAASRHSLIPYARVARGGRAGGLRDEDRPRYQKAANAIAERGMRIEKVGSRTVDELAREFRRRRLTVAVVDLLNALPGTKQTLREQVEHNVKVLAAAAQESGTRIIAVNHLSPKGRMAGGDYPEEPVLTDFRESTQLGDLTHNALMIYLYPEEYEDGNGRIRHRPGKQAVLKVEKAKEGERGSLELVADFEHMRFLLPVAPGTVGSAT